MQRKEVRIQENHRVSYDILLINSIQCLHTASKTVKYEHKLHRICIYSWAVLGILFLISVSEIKEEDARRDQAH